MGPFVDRLGPYERNTGSHYAKRVALAREQRERKRERGKEEKKRKTEKRDTGGQRRNERSNRGRNIQGRGMREERPETWGNWHLFFKMHSNLVEEYTLAMGSIPSRNTLSPFYAIRRNVCFTYSSTAPLSPVFPNCELGAEVVSLLREGKRGLLETRTIESTETRALELQLSQKAPSFSKSVKQPSNSSPSLESFSSFSHRLSLATSSSIDFLSFSVLSATLHAGAQWRRWNEKNRPRWMNREGEEGKGSHSGLGPKRCGVRGGGQGGGAAVEVLCRGGRVRTDGRHSNLSWQACLLCFARLSACPLAKISSS